MLPQPRITRIYHNGARHYQVEGYDEPFPSVTTVLRVISKEALVPWAKRVALESVRAALTERMGSMAWLTPEWVEEVIEEARRRPEQERDQAADFGTQAHILIDAIIRGQEPDIPPEMETVITSFLAWRRGAGLDIHLSEKMVYSARHGYAGAMDAVGCRDGKLVALDWKTSNGIYPEYALQVAAYAKALEEMSGEKVIEAWVVRLGKATPEFEARKVVDLGGTFTTFLATLSLWRGMQQPLF